MYLHKVPSAYPAVCEIQREADKKICLANNTIETTGANIFYGNETKNYIIPRLINEVPKSLKDKITIHNIEYEIKDYFLVKL